MSKSKKTKNGASSKNNFGDNDWDEEVEQNTTKKATTAFKIEGKTLEELHKNEEDKDSKKYEVAQWGDDELDFLKAQAPPTKAKVETSGPGGPPRFGGSGGPPKFSGGSGGPPKFTGGSGGPPKFTGGSSNGPKFGGSSAAPKFSSGPKFGSGGPPKFTGGASSIGKSDKLSKGVVQSEEAFPELGSAAPAPEKKETSSKKAGGPPKFSSHTNNRFDQLTVHQTQKKEKVEEKKAATGPPKFSGGSDKMTMKKAQEEAEKRKAELAAQEEVEEAKKATKKSKGLKSGTKGPKGGKKTSSTKKVEPAPKKPKVQLEKAEMGPSEWGEGNLEDILG